MHKPRIILRLAAVLAIAGALAGTASFVSAQQFPQTLPPNTAVGRLGAGQSGPAQAVPFGSIISTANRTIWVNDPPYNAKCDGVTDDHVVFQAAITAAQLSSAAVRFSGNCAIATGLTISNTLDFGAVNNFNDILICSAGITCLTVDTDNPAFLHDFGIAYPSTSGSDTSIVVTSTAGGHTQNSSTNIWRVLVESSFNGINFANAQTWVLRDSSISVAGGDGLIVANTFNGDHGDATAYGNEIGSSVSGGNGVHWKSSGGFRFTNNKIIGTAFNIGFLIDQATGLATSDLYIIGNSFEGLAASGAACIQLQRNGNTATLFNVMIISNECAGPDIGVYEVLDGTGQWILGLTAADNMIGLSSSTNVYGYRLLSPISGLTIHHGVVEGGSGTNVAVVLGTQTAANCAVGPIAKTGTFSGSTLSSCTSYTPD